MSGIKYLLDTNIILGLLKATSTVLEAFTFRSIQAAECGYSAITRMELLGYSGITAQEEHLIYNTLAKFTYCGLTRDVENMTIRIRQTHKIKLPDAIIAATALSLNLELLSMDKQLLRVIRELNGNY